MNYLEQLFFNDHVIKEINLPLDEKSSKTIKLVIRSLTQKDYSFLHDLLINIEKVSDLKISEEYLSNIAYLITLELGGTKFKNYEHAKEVLSNKSSILIEKIIKEHKKFEQELKDLLNPEEIDKNFSKTPQTLNESRQN